MTVKSVKTFQRNCVGGAAVTDEEKYLDDQIITLCMYVDLDEVELEFAQKCKIIYASTYGSVVDGITDPDCVRSTTSLRSCFDKEYLFFPIGKGLHWSLCIVCHPLYFLIKAHSAYFDEAEKTIFRNILDSNYTSCIIFLDSVPGYHDYLLIFAEVTLFLTRKWKEYTQTDRHRDFEGLVSDCITNDQYKAFVKWMSKELEPYAGDNEHNIFRNMMRIDHRLGLRQDNGFDCGYYVAMNFRAFVKHCASGSYEELIATISSSDRWFTYDDIVNQKRTLLARLLNGLPSALDETDHEYLADIWIYLHPEYDVFKKTQTAREVREKEALMANLKRLLLKRKAAELELNTVEREFDAFCKTSMPKVYDCKTACEDDITAIQNAVEDSYIEGDNKKIAWEIVNKSFPAQVDNDENEDMIESQLSQSSSFVFTQSSSSSESTNISSQDSRVVEPIKSRTIPNRNTNKQPKPIGTRSNAHEEDKAIIKKTQFSSYTKEFISQHTKKLFTVFYQTEENARSSSFLDGALSIPGADADSREAAEESAESGMGGAHSTTGADADSREAAEESGESFAFGTTCQSGEVSILKELAAAFVGGIPTRSKSSKPPTPVATTEVDSSLKPSKKVSFSGDNNQTWLERSEALELVRVSDPETFRVIKDKPIVACRSKKTRQIGIAVNYSDENVPDETKQCPFIYVILQLDKNTGNYVKVGSAIFQQDRRLFTSRIKTFCPGTFVIF